MCNRQIYFKKTRTSAFLCYTACTVTKRERKVQAANVLNYSVQKQRNNKALFVVFSFARAYNALTESFTVTQRIAHNIVSASSTATLEQIADIVAQQRVRDNAASVRNYTSSAVIKQLQKNTNAA
jgi:hypothetical protein